MSPRRTRRALGVGVALVLALSGLAHAEHFDSDGVQIYYRLDGAGEPVVLIHGYSANGAVNFRTPGIVADLAHDRLVITIDNRGHGQSEKPEQAGVYGLHMVNDVVRLLDHLELDSADIVGYSMGAMIGLKLAIDHPDRVRSLLMGGMGWTRQSDEVRQRYSSSGVSSVSAIRRALRVR